MVMFWNVSCNITLDILFLKSGNSARYERGLKMSYKYNKLLKTLFTTAIISGTAVNQIGEKF